MCVIQPSGRASGGGCVFKIAKGDGDGDGADDGDSSDSIFICLNLKIYLLCYAMRSVLDDIHVLVRVLNVVISLMNDGMNVIVMGVWSGLDPILDCRLSSLLVHRGDRADPPQ